LRTPISYSQATIVQALESEHENPGLSDVTLRVHIVKPSGVHNRYCVQEMCIVNISTNEHELRQ